MSNDKECLPFVSFIQNDNSVEIQTALQLEEFQYDVINRYDFPTLTSIVQVVRQIIFTPTTFRLNFPAIRKDPPKERQIAEFIFQYAYTEFQAEEILYQYEPERPDEQQSEELTQLLEELEEFTKNKDSGGKGFQMPNFGGGMCGSEQLTQVLQKVQDLTGAIQHPKDLEKPDPKFSPKPPAPVQSMIDQMKQKVESLGKSELQKVVRMMGASGGMGVEQAVEGALKRLGSNAVFLRPEHIEAIKNNLDRVGSQSAAQFKDPNQKDNLKLQIFRMCQTADSMGDYLSRPSQANSDYMSREQDRIKESEAETQEKIGSAKSQGIEIPPYAKRRALQFEMEQKAKRRMAAAAASGQTYVDPADDAATGIGDQGKVPVSQFKGATAEEAQWVAQFKQKAANRQNPSDGNIKVVGGALQNILNPNRAERKYKNSIVGARDQVLIMARRVAKTLGVPLSITSAYRCPPYNRRVGGAKNSNHMQGIALDILYPGTSQEKFIAACSRVGFTGMSTYASFLHVDIGRLRTWGGGRRNRYVQKHLKGIYKKS